MREISYVPSLLTYESVIIQAKALWLLGEMRLAHPVTVKDTVPEIAAFFDSSVSLLRERAVNATAESDAVITTWPNHIGMTEHKKPVCERSILHTDGSVLSEDGSQ